MAEERLQKILSRAGVASRRKAEQLIVEGRVTVNRQTLTELGSKADLERDHIEVDGQRLRAPRRLLYLALNKPKGCVTTVHDPEGRATVMQFLKGVPGRVFPVGRLDYASEGLLLVTNDGEFANRVMSASSHLPKTYLVKVNGSLSPEQEQQFREGIPLGGRRTAPAGLRLVRRAQNPWYEVRLMEGRQNQVRIMFKHFGRLVEKLKRIRIGFLELGGLRPGQYRALTPAEAARFRGILKMERGERGEHP
jgi:pseudouridine synthase